MDTFIDGDADARQTIEALGKLVKEAKPEIVAD